MDIIIQKADLQQWTSLIAICIKYSTIQKKKRTETRIIKTFSIEDVGRQNPKSSEQGWEVNVRPKIKQTTSI